MKTGDSEPFGKTPDILAETQFTLYQNIIPRTIVPPLTNGGMIRSMDNRQLAAWLAQQHENTAKRGAWTEEEYFRWLNSPTVDSRGG